MREDTRRKLDDAQKTEMSFRLIALLSLCAVGIFFGGYRYASRVTVSEHSVAGRTQRAVWRIDPDTGQSYPDFEANLEDGRRVRISTTVPNLPAVGTKLVLTEKTRATGYRSYIWDGQTAPTEKR